MRSSGQDNGWCWGLSRNGSWAVNHARDLDNRGAAGGEAVWLAVSVGLTAAEEERYTSATVFVSGVLGSAEDDPPWRPRPSITAQPPHAIVEHPSLFKVRVGRGERTRVAEAGAVRATQTRVRRGRSSEVRS